MGLWLQVGEGVVNDRHNNKSVLDLNVMSQRTPDFFIQKKKQEKPGRTHPQSYSDTKQKECIQQKMAGTSCCLPLRREPGVMLVYC